MNWIHIFKIVVDVILVAGVVMMLIGAIQILISAFRESILWGLGCLFLPFCALIYLIVHWEDAKSGFFLKLKGIFVIVLAVFGMAIFNVQRDRAARVHAREAPAASQPDNDPSATNSIEKGRPAASPKNSTAATNPTFRLQGILYNSTKPTAVINGNTVFVGDKVSEWTVTAISNQTVTLQSGSGEINTLTLK